jgi:rhodanese-related sulfurtransferase
MGFSFKEIDTSRGIPEVAPNEVQENLNKVHVVDVRSDEEFADGHIKGAELYPVDEFPDALEHLPKDKTIVFVCGSGGRSGRATKFALENGFEQVYNMKGGMVLWTNLGYETEG